MFAHKGYIGSGCFSPEDGVFHGKIQNINDLVTYEAETMQRLELAFIEAVEDYIETAHQLHIGHPRETDDSKKSKTGER